MKKIFIIVGLVCINASLFAQTTEGEDNLKSQNTDTINGWKKGGTLGFTFSQVSLTNWAAGGVNSFSVNGMTNLFANLKQGKISWDNSLDIGYGVIRQGNNNALWIKSDDKLDFASKFGYQLKSNLNFAVLYNFRTQFSPGYDALGSTNLISDLLAPAYSLLAVGVDYKKGDTFSAFFAPATLKTTIVKDQKLADAGAFGVEGAVYDDLGSLISAGKNIRNEFGGYIKLQYRKELITNVGLDTKLDLFSNYLNNPQNIDVNWETTITLKVNKFLSANLTTHLIYDDDIKISVDNNSDGVIDAVGPRIQFKEVFGAGLSFKF
ncbi:MAG: DUF3078 domain-containing protein [Flavobacteriales bacterium]|nr:DUF3078 domain-containing protein [Flavobacteriales bacterium]